MSHGLALELKGVSKRFPGVVALDHVDFSLQQGEVHCLVGENGAGKSTLIKIITGAYARDEGELRIHGRRVDNLDARKARELGIGAIYQEMNLVPALTVVENIFLGNEQLRGPFSRLNWQVMKARTRAVLAELGVELDPGTRVDRLSTAEQQVVEIAKALVLEKDILIMDEPTASLTQQNAAELFRIVRQLKRKGVAILYISHRLQELPEIGDRVTVLRDGRVAGHFPMSRVDIPEVIRLMVGRELGEAAPLRKKTGGLPPEQEEPLLRIEGLAREPRVKSISFSVRAGEIAGFAGLVGAGRTELMRLLFGADRADSGAVYLAGNRLLLRSPVDAVRHGIGMLTEDRKGQGLVLGMPVRANITLPSLHRFVRLGRIRHALEKAVAAEQVASLRVATPSVEQAVSHLSGGNQQKVVLAKWLTTRCRVLIFDEPTRGIDVGAKAEIYGLMRALADQGLAILMVSSDLPEILRLSDRVLVMANGRLTGEISGSEATQEAIMSLMLGGAGDVA